MVRGPGNCTRTSRPRSAVTRGHLNRLSSTEEQFGQMAEERGVRGQSRRTGRIEPRRAEPAEPCVPRTGATVRGIGEHSCGIERAAVVPEAGAPARGHAFLTSRPAGRRLVMLTRTLYAHNP